MKNALAIVALTVAFVGCGPVESSVVIRDASVQLEAARVSDAERFAQFEFRAATEYLHKAREEQNYSEYQEAIELAQAAYEYAEKARARALGHPDRAANLGQPLRPKVKREQPPRPKHIPDPPSEGGL